MTGRVVVPMGGMEVRPAPALLAALALGSCVAVILHDRVALVGGLVHVLLPTSLPRGMRGAPTRFAESAVPALLDALLDVGAEQSRLTARLVGGATMFANLVAPGLISIGERNALAAREALDLLGIRVVGEAVGGDFGRSASLDVATGRVQIRSVRHGCREL